MRFAVTHPLLSHSPDPELSTAAGLAAVASTAESVGFDGFGVTDHPAPDSGWLRGGGHPALDPFVALTWAAAHTTTIRLITNLLVLPYRNPFVVASAANTLDAMAGGRLTMTLGTGYLESEFNALGIDISERNERFDDHLNTLKAAWAGGPVSAEGIDYTATGIETWPPSTQPGGPPVWIGGNAPLSQRRAARVGNGWAPFPAGRGLAAATKTRSLRSADDLAPAIENLRKLASVEGRDPDALDVAFSITDGGTAGTETFDPHAVLAAAEGLEAVGVTWCWVTVPGDSVSAALQGLREFGERVISA